jgi:hypothetical protein
VEYQFQSVAGVIRFDDGRVVVADAGASEMRVYDPAGRFVRAAGRPGDGPGEYRLIHAIGAGLGDTVWVFDFGTRRFTLLTPSLTVARTVTLGVDLAAVLAVGMTPDGGFVVRESWSSRAPAGDPALGLRRDSIAIARLDVAGNLVDTTALMPGREVIVSSEGGRAVMSAPVVARAASAALSGDAVVLGDQGEYERRVLGLDGTVRRIVRRAGVDLRLAPADLETAIAARLTDVPAAQRAARRLALEALPHPATRPAYGPLVFDDEGRIWAGDWTPAGDPPRAWAVFAGDGRYLGQVAMPHGFRPFWIRQGIAAGVWRDDLGVERVRVYRIERE